MDINPKHQGEREYTIPCPADNVVNLALNLGFGSHTEMGSVSIPDSLSDYPSHRKLPDLISEISEYTGTRPNEVLVTNGSGNALFLILRTFFNEGKKVLVPFPNYPGFIHDATLIYGRENVLLERDPLPHIPRSDIAYFSSPNLPLGTLLSPEFMDIVHAYPSKLFIVDEAYIEYSSNPAGILRYSGSSIPPNMIVTRTMSKAFMLAGARIGYILANEGIISQLRIGYTTKDILDTSIDYALTALRNRKVYIDNATRTMTRMRALVASIRDMIAPGSMIGEVSSGDGPFFLLYSEHPAYLVKLYHKNGFMVRDKSDEIPGAVRVGMMGEKDEGKFLSVTLDICGKGKYGSLYIDIDGTLRPTRSSPLFPSALLLRDTPARKIIVSNSLQKREELEKLLEPLGNYHMILPPIPGGDPPPIPGGDTSGSGGWSVHEGVVYIYRFPDMGSRELISAIRREKNICIVEQSMFEMLSEDAPLPPGEQDDRIGHVGLFISIMRDLYPWMSEVSIRIIGKTAWTIERDPEDAPELMIGDTINDYMFAEHNGMYFYKVQGDDTSLREAISSSLPS